MDLFKRIVFFAFVIFILLLFIWALYIPKQDIKETISQTLKEQKERLDLYYKGVTFQEISGGVKYWEIKAKTSSINRTTGVATLEDTNGIFFSRGEPALKFKAPLAVWFLNAKEIHLYKPVGYDAKAQEKYFSSKAEKSYDALNYFELPSRYNGAGRGFFFKAQTLRWNLKSKKVVCEAGIWIRKGEISGKAERLEADVALEKIKLSGQPEMHIENTYPATLEAEKFELDSFKNLLSAQNNVVLTANQIKIETKNALYDQASSIIKLKNKVTATYGQFKAEAQNASYNIKQQKMVLKGNARLLRGSSMLTGHAILVDVKSKEFKVKGKSKVIVPEKELNK